MESAMLAKGNALCPFVIGAIHVRTAKKQQVTNREAQVKVCCKSLS
jgi:hypothetical protein